MARARGDRPAGGTTRPAPPDRSAPGGGPASRRHEMSETVPRKELVP